MASPVTVGTVASVVALKNVNRSIIRFQNVGTTTINLKKIPLSGPFSTVSTSDFEIQLFPSSSNKEAGEAFETNSIASFMAISSSSGGALAIFETHKVL